MLLYILVGLAFVFGASVVLGSFFGVTKLPGLMLQRKLEARLEEVSMGAGLPSPRPRAVRPRPSHWSRSTRVARCRGSIGSSAGRRAGSALGRWIEQSGVKTTFSAVLLIAVALAGVFGIGTMMLVKATGACALGGHRRLRPAVLVPELEARQEDAQVRRGVPGSARPHLESAQGRPRLHHRPEDGGRRDARADRTGVQKDLRRTELRSAAQGRAREPDLPHAEPRRAVLRDRRAHPARDRRQPLGDPREPRARRPRAVQDSQAGAGLHGARAHDRLRAAGAARRALHRAACSSIRST